MILYFFYDVLTFHFQEKDYSKEFGLIVDFRLEMHISFYGFKDFNMVFEGERENVIPLNEQIWGIY